MIELKGYYFKFLNDEGDMHAMSGLHLPNPEKTYHFISCEIHPRLWEAIKQMYKHCKFTDTYVG